VRCTLNVRFRFGELSLTFSVEMEASASSVSPCIGMICVTILWESYFVVSIRATSILPKLALQRENSLECIDLEN
jgi:hypothetical protein